MQTCRGVADSVRKGPAAFESAAWTAEMVTPATPPAKRGGRIENKSDDAIYSQAAASSHRLMVSEGII